MNNRPLYAPYIDGLRAIGVLSVIVYHLHAGWLPGGFVGVDEFFVISGFVVSISVSDFGKTNLPRFMLYFYARRLTRIAPALVICLLVTFVGWAAFIPISYLSDAIPNTGAFAFVGLSNFVLAKNVGGYFSTIAEFNPFTHTWSLAIEEQFYVLFPLMFLPWLNQRRGVSIAVFTTFLTASLICAAWLGRVDETNAFYMIWARFWELGAGVLLFQTMAARGHSFVEQSPYNLLAAIGADVSAMILAASLIVARPNLAPFPACTLTVIGAVGLLGFLHGRPGGFTHKLLTLKPMLFVGRVSYSLYLWHWPVFVLFRWTAGLESMVSGIVALTLTGALSVASFYFVETPPRRIARGVPRLAILAAGFSLVAIGYGASRMVVTNEPSISLSTVSHNVDIWYPYGSVTAADFPGCSVYPQVSTVNGVLHYVYARTGCSAPVTFKHTLFVIGDSHALAYNMVFIMFSLRTGATVHVYTSSGCSFISFRPWNPGWDDHCAENGRTAIADIMQQIHSGDVVFLPSLRLPYLVEQWASHGYQSAREQMFGPVAVAGRKDAEARAIPVLRELSERGARIVFEGPPPILNTVPFRCADWFNRQNPICEGGDSVSRAFLEELRQPVLQSYQTLGNAVAGVSVWDPFPILCPGTSCEAYHGGKPLFFDGDHLSGYANTLLSPDFEKFVHATGDPDQRGEDAGAQAAH